MSDYGYRIKNRQIRLVTGDDLTDYPTPTAEQLAVYREAVQARTPRLEGCVTKLTPDDVPIGSSIERNKRHDRHEPPGRGCPG
jgi:hypothetical protein